MAKAKLRILYGEADGDVLAEQAAAFEKAGHVVQKAEGRKKVNAETSVLVMHADGSRHPYVDACVDTGSSMETVLNRIETMKIAGMMPQAAAAAAGAGR